MPKNDWMHRIAIDPKIHAGKPCVKGTRIPVSVVGGSVDDGDTVAQILKAWPALRPADVRACMRYAAKAR